MSISGMYLCVYNDSVFRIPHAQMDEREILIPELANLTVLKAEVIYHLKDRVPNDILNLFFIRIDFDENGSHKIKVNNEEMRVKLEYIWQEGELPIPIAPVEPTSEEIVVLKEYFYKKFPSLLESDPYVIENSVLDNRDMHKRNIELMKKSHKKNKPKEESIMIRPFIKETLEELKKAKSIYSDMELLGYDLLIPLKEMDNFPTLKSYGKTTFNNQNGEQNYYIKYSMDTEDYSIKLAIHGLFDEPISLHEKRELTEQETKEINNYYEWWYDDMLLHE